MTNGEGSPSALALADEARADVAEVIQLLQRPDPAAFERSTIFLTTAVDRIERIQREGRGAGEGARAAIEDLRRDLHRVRLLLGHAWEFRVRCCGQAVYTSKGELTPALSGARRWTFEA
jgi:hypothetical protein